MAKILVVDDEHNIRMMIRMALQAAGYDVETAADGLEALDRFGTGDTFDLVLMDQRMPGLDGINVLKQMSETDPSAKVIMITAFGTIDLAVEAMKIGAVDFLRKPFTTDTLRGAVASALAQQAPALASKIGTVPSFALTTINGFRLESTQTAGSQEPGDTTFEFSVRTPSNQTERCAVAISPEIAGLVRAHARQDGVPEEGRFWQALCEEVLANYLYQHASVPTEHELRIDEFTSGMKRWVDALVSA